MKYVCISISTHLVTTHKNLHKFSSKIKINFLKIYFTYKKITLLSHLTPHDSFEFYFEFSHSSGGFSYPTSGGKPSASLKVVVSAVTKFTRMSGSWPHRWGITFTLKPQRSRRHRTIHARKCDTSEVGCSRCTSHARLVAYLMRRGF